MRRIRILQQNIKKEENNLMHLERRKSSSKNENIQVLQLNTDENLKNSTIEKLRKNLNSSNIFENISEISNQDINFIDRAVKNSIFESENNRNSKSHINENELIRDRMNKKEKIYKAKNRLDNNNYDSMRIKDSKNINSNMLMKSDYPSRFNFIF